MFSKIGRGILYAAITECVILLTGCAVSEHCLGIFLWGILGAFLDIFPKR